MCPSSTLDPDPSSLSAPSELAALAAVFAFEPTAFAILLGIFLLLLLASALFSGAEVALFSLEGPDRELLAAAKDRASQRVLTLLETPRRLLITILLLNTTVNVAAAILAAIMTAQIATHLGLNHLVVVIVEVVVLTFVLLVVSEITPKLIATQQATRFSRRVSGVLLILHRLLGPLTRLLAGSMQALQQRLKPSALERVSTDDLKAMAEIGQEHGSLELQERELIHSIVEFGETSVREIMVSRVDIIALPITTTFPEAIALIRECGHSRLPLYDEHLDNIVGIIYAKDLLPYLHTTSPTGNGASRLDLRRLARPPMFVPTGRKLDDLLKDFQLRKTHMAIVVDEYGGTAGLVTLEDVLEEIVGDIRDEHDENEEVLYEQLADDTYRFDARIDLDDVNELLDVELETEQYDFETLGGLIFDLAGDIPEKGDTFDHGPLQITVETVDNHRIGQVRVTVQAPTATGSADEATSEHV